MKIRRILLVGLAVIGVALPIATMAFVKPLRVAVPTLMPGITCTSSAICIDDVSRLATAEQLYLDGSTVASKAVGQFRQAPRMIFCSTSRCANMFGMGTRAAEAVGDIGLVVAPRGWTTFYVAHELIHHRQAEELGNLALFMKPKWMIEGMAYSLSKDPRHPLGGALEQWRSQFEAWRADRDTGDFWEMVRAVD